MTPRRRPRGGDKRQIRWASIVFLIGAVFPGLPMVGWLSPIVGTLATLLIWVAYLLLLRLITDKLDEYLTSSARNRN
jgi:hypothetical protein